MALRSGIKVGRAPQVRGLVAGLVVLWVGTAAVYAQSAAQPAARVPWEQIETDVGSLIHPQPVFAPNPPYTEAARESRTGGAVVIELVLDSEGCPVSEKLLKPLSKGLADQTLATLRWWAFQPARYENTTVGFKLTMTVRFAIA